MFQKCPRLPFSPRAPSKDGAVSHDVLPSSAARFSRRRKSFGPLLLALEEEWDHPVLLEAVA